LLLSNEPTCLKGNTCIVNTSKHNMENIFFMTGDANYGSSV